MQSCTDIRCMPAWVRMCDAPMRLHGNLLKRVPSALTKTVCSPPYSSKCWYAFWCRSRILWAEGCSIGWPSSGDVRGHLWSVEFGYRYVGDV